MALWKSRTANRVVCAALGWALNTTVLPAAIMLMVLLIRVPVAFVTGVSAPITPTGAYSKRVRPSSPVQALGSMSSTPGVFSAASLFSFSLSSTLPSLVSDTAMLASSSVCSMVALRTAPINFVRSLRLMATRRFWASTAIATPWSSVSQTPS